MSRVVMPRAYNARIRSLDPSSRVWPLRTICGSKVPLRSGGTARSTALTSVSTVFGLLPVAAVPAAPASRIVFLIAQVPGHLLSQRPFQHRLGHLGQQPVRAEQLDTPGLGLAQQLIRQLLINQRPAARLIAIGLTGHLRSVIHCVSFREPQFLRPIVRPRHLHSRQDTPDCSPGIRRP